MPPKGRRRGSLDSAGSSGSSKNGLAIPGAAVLSPGGGARPVQISPRTAPTRRKKSALGVPFEPEPVHLDAVEELPPEFDEEVERPESLLACVQLEDPSLDDVRFFISEDPECVTEQDDTFAFSPLLFAASAGLTRVVSLLLEAGADIQGRCNYGNTALHLASRHGQLQTTKYLISQKAHLEDTNSVGWTPLISTACAGHCDVLQVLMAASANAHVVDEQGRSACMYAASHGHEGIVERLVAVGLNLALQDHGGMTVADHAGEHARLREAIQEFERRNRALLQAARDSDLDAALEALNAGASVNNVDEDGLSSLYWAMVAASEEMVWLLISRGANPLLTGCPPFSDALRELRRRSESVAAAVEHGLQTCDRLIGFASVGRWQEAETALQTGAFIGARDSYLRTPLMWAAVNGSGEIVHRLVGVYGAIVDELDGGGWTALHYAAFNTNHGAAVSLLELKADPKLDTFAGERLPHLAAQGNDAGPLLRLLCKALGKREFMKRDMHEVSPLQAAAINGSGAALCALMALKADPRETDRQGRPVLSLAAERGHVQTVTMMLEYCSMDRDGEEDEEEEEEEAEQEENDEAQDGEAEVVQAPRRSQASSPRKVEPVKPVKADELLTANDDDGSTALALAAYNGHSGAVAKLLEHHAPVDAVDSKGNTPLLLAAASGDMSCVQLLLDARADINARNHSSIGAIALAPSPRLKELLRHEAEQRMIQGKLGYSPGGMADVRAVDRPKKGSYRIRLEQLPAKYTGVLLEKRIRKLFEMAAAQSGHTTQQPAPEISNVRVVLDPLTERPRGHAYVDLGRGRGVHDYGLESSGANDDVREEVLGCVQMAQVKSMLGTQVRFIQEPC